MKSPFCLSPISLAGWLCLCIYCLIHPGSTIQAVSTAASADTQSLATKTPASQRDNVTIPGPLRSFLRMAGISQKVSKDDVLALLARNVYLRGYQQSSPTEFLILIDRYVNQARELQVLAGASSTIRVAGCDDAGTLVHILGYRLREGCGQKNFTLETANPERAFLTIDSGFPLVELEEALQKGTPFTYPYQASRVPALFHEGDWIGLSQNAKTSSGSLLDVLLSDPSVARLYWALAKTDDETSLALRNSPGLRKLLPFGSILDFYGSQICIRSGRVVVPGGEIVNADWKELVGASPEKSGEFVTNLLAKDNGWLAAYFDTLSRVSRTQQVHLTEPPRLKQLYDVFRKGANGTNAVSGVFPKAPDLLVLFTRIQWESNGDPHVPGNLEVWKEILLQKSDSKTVRSWVKRARSWDRPEQLLETMTALSSIDSDNGPLQIYLTLSELDRGRQPANRLSPETVRQLADRFSKLNNWYLMFAEFPALNDAGIASFMKSTDVIEKISNQTLRGNALGAFQATVGLWQILARQGQIPETELNTSWQKVIEPFTAISSSTQLFDSTQKSLQELLLAAGSKVDSSQEELVELLAGPSQATPDGLREHIALAARINSVLEDQRLVSLDTLFALSKGLAEMAQGKGKSDALLPLAAELREFDLPRPIFTNSEKISWAPPNYTAHHAELQVRTDLTKVIKEKSSHAQLETARGQLMPFLRDTLVGLNYAYYEPPGAQMLHHNPLFVRSHDFLGISIQSPDRLWSAPILLGAGSPAGGGAYLVGSLVDLSYALATTEQDFIAPENIQALIWKDLVPELLVGATLPRWWSVTPVELHAATLYQKSGEELLTASAGNAQIREKVIAILSDRLTSQRLERVQQSLFRAEDVAGVLPQMTPAETAYVAAEYESRFPEENSSWGPAGQQLQELQRQYPAEVSWEHLSRDFGVPHPTMARTNACQLLNVKPFPFFGSYSSRLFGESWESSNLYWARLADEMGYSPVALNSLVPELSRRAVSKIFATEPDDWPAILRAIQETGDEFRQSKTAGVPGVNITSTLSERTGTDANTH
ncbi:hypothetical protein [Tunturibacter empetritectus]|uniref:Uncharacterized protein n=1 Tax=Tunturiibacter lichenicola TaxID=2051959 RepID=A0A7W8J6I1_9BACT|nr:hypothetical protein [Edaphobacter lichenicola]MBB5343453.1 hypothetical protein [Edaphobacter lichenicola]